ncbi:TetR-like C-terminal domain-containing protein [Solibacillus sp. FSL R7-0668]|uniref:TetR/AcrR family transcriptional regulator n=1 Tax=Solibacillus sp. FSL R7-0668 TaxID=2921688 RepID=UPI0030FAC046
MKIDPRRVKSIEKLHNAYLSLLIEGHEQLTIQTICNKANVTRPTFYKTYKDIPELRGGLLQSLLENLKAALVIQDPKPIDVIDKDEMPKHLILLFNHIQSNHIAYETLLIYQPDALFIDGIHEILKEFVKNGIYVSEAHQYLLNVHEELIVNYVVGGFLESIRWWIKENYSVSVVEMAATLIELSVNGPYVKRFR